MLIYPPSWRLTRWRYILAVYAGRNILKFEKFRGIVLAEKVCDFPNASVSASAGPALPLATSR